MQNTLLRTCILILVAISMQLSSLPPALAQADAASPESTGGEAAKAPAWETCTSSVDVWVLRQVMKNVRPPLEPSVLDKLDSSAVSRGIATVDLVKLAPYLANVHWLSYTKTRKDYAEDDFEAVDAKDLVEILAVMENLETLVLTGNKLGDEGAATIAPAVQKLMKLHKLDLADNGIKVEGAKALAEAFIDHRALKRIELGKEVTPRDLDWVKIMGDNYWFEEKCLDLGWTKAARCVIAAKEGGMVGTEELDKYWAELEKRMGFEGMEDI